MRMLSRRNSRSMHSSRWNSVISRTKTSRPPPSPFHTPPQSEHGGEEREACDEEGAPDVPMEPTSSGSGVAGDSARLVAGTAKKRRCLGSADALHEVVERDCATLRGRCVTLPSFVCVNGLNRQKLQKELLRFFGCSRRRMNGTLCFWDRKGNSFDEGWVGHEKGKQKFFF